jgi:hypothetical protein
VVLASLRSLLLPTSLTCTPPVFGSRAVLEPPPSILHTVKHIRSNTAPIPLVGSPGRSRRPREGWIGL